MNIDFFEQWKKLWQRHKYVLLVVLVGAVLLMIPGGKTQDQPRAAPAQTGNSFDLQGMERRMEQALSQISGAGKVTVVLTLKEDSRQVLARDTQVSDRDQRTETVVLSTGSGTQGVVPVQNIWPKYQGALVVCTGGADAHVKLAIVDAVRALTGLSTERISICKGE